MKRRQWAVLLIALAIAWTCDAREHARLSSSSSHFARTAAKTKSPTQGRKAKKVNNKEPLNASPTAIVRPSDNEEENDAAMDVDFEKSAAEWREWLQQREEERRRDGDSMDDMAPDLADQSWPNLDLSLPQSHASRSARSRTAVKSGQASTRITGRRHYMLDTSRPINLLLNPSQPIDLQDLSNLETYDPVKHSNHPPVRNKMLPRKQARKTRERSSKPIKRPH